MSASEHGAPQRKELLPFSPAPFSPASHEPLMAFGRTNSTHPLSPKGVSTEDRPGQPPFHTKSSGRRSQTGNCREATSIGRRTGAHVDDLDTGSLYFSTSRAAAAAGHLGTVSTGPAGRRRGPTGADQLGMIVEGDGVPLRMPSFAQMMRNRVMIYCAVALGVLVLISLVVTSGILNTNEGETRQQTKFVSHPMNQNQSTFAISESPLNTGTDAMFCDTHDLIQLYVNVSSVTPNNLGFNLHLLFYPCGKFAVKDVNQNRFNIRDDVNFTIGASVFPFFANTPMSSQDFSSKFVSGSPNSYPFDSYVSPTIAMSATQLQDGATSPVPIQVTIVGALQTFSISLPEVIDISPGGVGAAIEATVHVARSFTTKLFSVFVMATMWLLSLLTFFLSLTPWTRAYRVEAATLAIANTLLFALPSLRNSQAGIGSIGCTADVVSFFCRTTQLQRALTAKSKISLNLQTKPSRSHEVASDVIGKSSPGTDIPQAPSASGITPFPVRSAKATTFNSLQWTRSKEVPKDATTAGRRNTGAISSVGYALTEYDDDGAKPLIRESSSTDSTATSGRANGSGTSTPEIAKD
ncbi:hypothetical protein DFJ73DRAFT_164744 [Zopfochytrium polystomum]|nr:hypothetical protein DFJ73DRAFT_164744 [Zopfochytrium polystomum]